MLSVTEVAGLLELSHQRVNRLAEAGLITRVARGLFERTSVERYRVERGSHRARTWTERTAWGAIAMLSGAAPYELGDTQSYRLRADLREITDPVELTSRLRNRATVTIWSGHRSVVNRIRHDIAAPGRQRLGLVEDVAVVDGYVHTDRLGEFVNRYRLSEDPIGSITLRSTNMDLVFVDYLITLNTTLAAVDAATSLDPRERGVGEHTLVRRLELLRENARR